MTATTSWYSSGYDLWIVPYPSPWFSKMDWWSQFFLSQNLDLNSFQKSTPYIADVRRFLPNKKIWIYPKDQNVLSLIPQAEEMARKLNLSSIRLFSLENNIEAPESSNFQWDIVE